MAEVAAGKLNLVSEENNAAEARTAYVKITATNAKGSVDKVVTVTQKGTGAVVETYSKFTGTLVEGDYILVYDGGAMTAAVTSGRLNVTDVTISTDIISKPDPSIVWHLAPDGESWTIFNSSSGKYAAGRGVKNKADLLTSITDYSCWTVSNPYGCSASSG